MPVVKGGQAPYASEPSLMEVIDAFRHRSPKTPVTLEELEMLGTAESVAPRTLQALKLLDLLDEAGEPTSALIGLKEAPEDELPGALADVVRAAYAELLAYRDPAQDSPEKIVDAFRMYEPASMRPRMVRLFYGLCKRAGMIEEVPAVGNKPGSGGVKADGTRRRSSKTRGTPKPSTTAGQSGEPVRNPPPPPPPAPRTGLDGLHPALLGLLKAVPAADQPWDSKARYERFKAAWDATLAVSNPVPAADSEDDKE